MKPYALALLSPIALSLLCATGISHAADLTVVNFGGANANAQKVAYIEPFQKATGNKITTVEFNGELAKVKAMVEAKKVIWDVVEIDGGDLARACDDGLIEKLDLLNTIKKDDYLPEAINNECGMGAFVWSTAMAYDADKLKTPPQNWVDFWDTKKYPGKRGMKKSAEFTLEFALMADGVPTKDVYKVLSTKAGVDRAFKKLDQLKPNIQWWDAGALPAQYLVAGDVVMAAAYNGRIDAAQREGKNLKVVWAGSIYTLDYWVIPKGSPNKAQAEKFISYATDANNQKVYANNIAYGPVNKNTLKLLDAKTLGNLPTSTANARDAVQLSQQFWTDHGEELEQRFAAWIAK
ncbi:putative spermidine/putrescine transport system substrate-binding protein [Herbaspirillum sp. Sphag1AN]|uniref:ABC transporter substrate-binding protein n=1 Tax=unclassified Herbaspirillum TaxID=2624150 RepID=UPI00160EF513|nr:MULTISPECIES: ABC transporter substrate-binding protein [unclassified Herbaspirillum]MBB3212103.1 putative spermidine/putrescine transport system substrate-binding protein [Herbaspirillum sp. Sphag1AN]MBB3244063.1 putative spermidine/putrescine transport system substrate-binding protein [Herbaspirillum sp. Sphag64]